LCCTTDTRLLLSDDIDIIGSRLSGGPGSASCWGFLDPPDHCQAHASPIKVTYIYIPGIVSSYSCISIRYKSIPDGNILWLPTYCGKQILSHSQCICVRICTPFMLQSHCHFVVASLYLHVDPHVVDNFVSISAACHVVPRSSHAIASL
jgi:hypothetical protein